MSWAKCAEDNYNCYLERLSSKGMQMCREEPARPLAPRPAPVIHPRSVTATSYLPYDPFRGHSWREYVKEGG